MSSECTAPETGALIHLYELGSLSNLDKDDFEIHLLSCESCFRQVQEFKNESAIMRDSLTIKELMAEPESETSPSGFWNLLWPKKPILLQPGISLLMVLLLVLPAIIGIKYLLSPGDSIQSLQMISITSTRSSGDFFFTKDIGLNGVINLSFRGAIAGHTYKTSIYNSDSTRVILPEGSVVMDDLGMGQIFIPLKKFEVDQYILCIADTANAKEPYHHYRFRVE